MIEKKKNKVVKYRLKGLAILDEKIESHLDSINEIKKFHFKVNIEQKIYSEKKLVINSVEIIITTDNESRHLGSIKVACVFEVENLELFYNPKTTKATFPKDFDSSLHEISISTARGIMFSQFKGTSLHNAILPVIDIKSLVQIKQDSKPKAPNQ